MAVKTAQRHTDGDQVFVYFSTLAGQKYVEGTGKDKGKGTLIVFRITELHDPERGDYSWHAPLTGHVLVVDSDENPEWNGKVFRDITVKFAPTWDLRGQAKPGDDVKRMRDIPEGDNEVGDDIIARIALKKGKSPNGFVIVNSPDSAEEKAALAAIKKAGGDDWPSDGEPARPSDAAKAAGDDEPPF